MSNTDVKKTLETLMALQEIDSQLAELEVSKIYYPRLLEQLRDEIVELETELRETREKVTVLKRDIKLTELDLAESKGRLTSSQQRLLTVQSNKEYDAVQHEIMASEEKSAQLEEEMIRLMEDLDYSQKKAEELDEKLESTRERNTAQIDQIQLENASIEEKMAKIMEQHEMLASSVDRRTLSAYNRIRGGTSGHAVVKVVSRACGGCFQSLPPRQCQEIKRMANVTFCEACGRILVWDDEVSP